MTITWKSKCDIRAIQLLVDIDIATAMPNTGMLPKSLFLRKEV